MDNQNEQLILAFERINKITNNPAILQMTELSQKISQMLPRSITEIQNNIPESFKHINEIVRQININSETINNVVNTINSFNNLNFESLDMEEETDIALEDLKMFNTLNKSVEDSKAESKLKLNDVLTLLLSIVSIILNVYSNYQQSEIENKKIELMQEIIENQKIIQESEQDFINDFELLRKEVEKSINNQTSSSIDNQLTE